MALTLPNTSEVQIARLTEAIYGAAPGYTYMTAFKADVTTNGINAFANWLAGTFSTTAATLTTQVVANLGLTGTAATDGTAYLNAQFAATTSANYGKVILDAVNAFSALTSDAVYGTAATSFNNYVATSYVYSINSANTTMDLVTLMAADTPQGTGITFQLNTGIDAITGTTGNDLFNARIYGATNSLQSGDVIDGGVGTTDTLYADLGTSQGFAITAETTNVETVKVRAQAIPVDATNGNNMVANTVQIDAQRMAGVTTWQSDNSRSDVIIEDVRISAGQITKDITIAMVETDPGNVDLGVYFDQLSLRNSGASSSVLNIQVMDTGAAATPATAATPLLNNPYDTFKFTATPSGGVAQVISLALPNAAAADTYATLLTAFQAAITNAGLTNVTASLGSSFSVIDPLSGTTVTGTSIKLTSTGGVTITTPTGSGWFNTTGASVPASSNMYTTYDTNTSSSTELVTSKIILDDVGRGSTGGDLVVGGLSVGDTSTSRGVERFEIEVRDNSKLQTINSTNNALREVTIVNGVTSSSVTNAYTTTTTNAGNLTVNGKVGADAVLAGVETGSAVGVHDSTFGLTDVRLIDASTFAGQLALTAQVTTDSIAKYMTLVDVAANPAADVAGAGNTNFNVAGANFLYTGGTNNDTMAVTIDALAAASRSTRVPGQSDFTFTIDGGNGDDAITVDLANGLTGAGSAWYTNQVLNNNITVNGGVGNDTIRTPGAGNITINSGDGNDTVYADNTGLQAGLVITGAVGIADGTTTSRAAWVLNTTDQLAATPAARNIEDLISSANDSLALYNTTVTVTFHGVTSTATVVGTNYKTTDLEINQAVKTAIDSNAILNKVLIAQDGPANTLEVRSLIDGVHVAADLTVVLTAATAASLTAAMVTAFNTANGTVYADGVALNAAMAATIAGKLDYVACLSNDGVAAIAGADSTTTSDNTITAGAGDDVLVLGTTGDATADAAFLAKTDASQAAFSNDTLVYSAAFGNDTVFNFKADADAGAGEFSAGYDIFNFTGLNGDLTTQADLTTLVATDKSINVIAVVATVNDTAALIKAILDAGATEDATASSHVYIGYVAATNVATVYTAVDGTGANDMTVTLVGTIDLADTGWAGLTLGNFV